MRVQLNLGSMPPTVELVDATDCSDVGLVIRGEDAEPVARVALARFGRLVDRQTAWLRLNAVRELADGFVTADWEQEFASFLTAAAARGRLSEDAAEVQAAVDWR